MMAIVVGNRTPRPKLKTSSSSWIISQDVLGQNQQRNLLKTNPPKSHPRISSRISILGGLLTRPESVSIGLVMALCYSTRFRGDLQVDCTTGSLKNSIPWRIHGTIGIFTHMKKNIKINHSCMVIYTSPMDGQGNEIRGDSSGSSCQFFLGCTVKSQAQNCLANRMMFEMFQFHGHAMPTCLGNDSNHKEISWGQLKFDGHFGFTSLISPKDLGISLRSPPSTWDPRAPQAGPHKQDPGPIPFPHTSSGYASMRVPCPLHLPGKFSLQKLNQYNLTIPGITLRNRGGS